MLEVTAAGLDALSHDLFRADPASGRVHPPAHEQADLQHSRSVDRAGDLASQIRDTLLGLARGYSIVAVHTVDGMPPKRPLNLRPCRR